MLRFINVLPAFGITGANQRKVYCFSKNFNPSTLYYLIFNTVITVIKLKKFGLDHKKAPFKQIILSKHTAHSPRGILSNGGIIF